MFDVHVFWGLTFIPIVWQPRRVHESGAGSLCCLSTRMCEFVATPLSCARRGNPDFSRDAKRRGALSWGYPILWARKEGVRKNILKTFVDTFFVRSKESIQRKGAQQLGLKALLAKTLNPVVITNSYPPAGLRHVITYFVSVFMNFARLRCNGF